MVEPSALRRQLGSELQALRTLAGLSQRDLRDRLSLGQVAISRIERGERLPTRAQVQEWLSHTAAAEDTGARVAALAEAAHGATTPWPELDVGGSVQAATAGREERSALVRSYSMSSLPGLLQTAEYARQLFPLVDPFGAVDPAASTAARVSRQQVLFQSGRRFEFVIAEHSLSWSPGPGVLPAQLDRIATLATLESVEVRVLPTVRVANPAWHSFRLFTPGDPDAGGDVFVTLELLHGGQELHDPAVVGAYERLWGDLWKAAAHGDEAAAMLRRAS